MLSDREKLEWLCKFESYVCKANAIAIVVSVVLGLAGVFHKNFAISVCSGVILAFMVTAVAGAAAGVIAKVKDRVLDRIWGG